MARTISHEAQAPVKKNPGKVAPARDWSQLSQDEVKAALLLLLNRTKEQLSDLQDEFDIIDTLIDPDPQPLPDTINPNTLFARLALVEERDAINTAAEALGREVETFRAAVKDMAGGLTLGRNVRAWGIILEKLGKGADFHLEALHAAIGSLMSYAGALSALVTFAQAEEVPAAFAQEVPHE